MDITDIIHTEDTETLNILKATPGMSHLMEQSLRRDYDERLWLETITTNLRLSEHQMPEIYNHLPPICKRLGIPIPELYLQLSPIVKASAYVYDNKPYIVLTLGLIRRIKTKNSMLSSLMNAVISSVSILSSKHWHTHSSTIPTSYQAHQIQQKLIKSSKP